MSLGSAFPSSIREASIDRQLVPGAIVKFRAVMDDGKVHEKRFVVLSVAIETLTCVINTDIPKLIQRNQSLLQCQVVVDSTRHAFMDWDSHIDCSRIRTYPTSEVVQQLRENAQWILGSIAEDVRTQIAAALKLSPLISGDVAAACCQSMGK